MLASRLEAHLSLTCSQTAPSWHRSPPLANEALPEQGRLPWDPRVSSSLFSGVTVSVETNIIGILKFLVLLLDLPVLFLEDVRSRLIFFPPSSISHCFHQQLQ